MNITISAGKRNYVSQQLSLLGVNNQFFAFLKGENRFYACSSFVILNSPWPRVLCRAGVICHTQSEWHIMWTHSGQQRSCFTPSPDQMFKRLRVWLFAFCCGPGSEGVASTVNPTPALSHFLQNNSFHVSNFQITSVTFQISRLAKGKYFLENGKYWQMRREATYLEFTRFIQVMVMGLTSS